MKLVWLLPLLFTGCTTLIPANETPRAPKKLPDKVLDVLLLPAEDNTVFSRELLEDDCSYTAYQCSVTIADSKPLPFKYLRSKVNPDNKHPLIFIYNILKDKEERVSHLLAGALTDHGYDCIIVQQEHFLDRKWTRPVLPDPDSPHLSYDEYNAHLARNINRIITLWIPKQKELDGRYGFVGVSLGGIHAVAAAALFPKADLTIAIMAGGDNLHLFKESVENLVIGNRNRLLEQYAKADKKADQLYNDIAGLKFTVLKLARCIKTSKIKLMITLNDTSVPTSAQWRLYYALGGPEARLFPCGHYTMLLYYFTIRDQMVEWMNEAFTD